jgi:hydrogenase maturation protease
MGAILEEYAAPGGLVLGIGNVGRQDDGLGWAFVDRLEEAAHPGTLERTYQLHLEDAALLSRCERVLFVDSTKEPGVTSYALTRPHPRLEVAFTSHALTIPTVLETCRQCFGVLPDTRVLAIRGYSFDLVEGLTPSGTANLAAAFAALTGDPEPSLTVPTPTPA